MLRDNIFHFKLEDLSKSGGVFPGSVNSSFDCKTGNKIDSLLWHILRVNEIGSGLATADLPTSPRKHSSYSLKVLQGGPDCCGRNDKSSPRPPSIASPSTFRCLEPGGDVTTEWTKIFCTRLRVYHFMVCSVSDCLLAPAKRNLATYSVF